MTKVRDFVVNLAIGGHSAAEIAVELDKTFGDKGMSMSQIWKIIRDVKANKDMEDQRPGNAVKTVRTPEIIKAVGEYVASDRRVSYAAIEMAFGLSRGTIFTILKDILGLVKKSSRWVARLLTSEQMK